MKKSFVAALVLLAAALAAHAQPTTPHQQLTFDIFKELVEIDT